MYFVVPPTDVVQVLALSLSFVQFHFTKHKYKHAQHLCKSNINRIDTIHRKVAVSPVGPCASIAAISSGMKRSMSFRTPTAG